MGEIHSDALAFFGATGDLAADPSSAPGDGRARHPTVPVIGVAKSGWSVPPAPPA
jgi:hypothetical protein